MSGFVGIINSDGTPIDQHLLQAMIQFMAYRGPDDQRIWTDGYMGLGHAMLRTTFESQRETQPYSLDGQVWITADARIDDQANLIQKLRAKAGGDLKSPTDAELILHAYRIWGEDCVQHLLGDFAFAIWDGPRKRLFCARDHFGVKPFYYAHAASCLIFSNTLNAIRMHPAVSTDLNESAIGDFLLFGFNREPATTTFLNIQRLPPAHYLTWSAGNLRINRYWSLPINGRIIRYKRPDDYVEHFRELLRQAVGDRLRTDRVAVWMSGGLDSTTLAATACQLPAERSRSRPLDLQAYCVVYDRLIPQRERYYSGLVAEALGIPIHYVVADNCRLFEGLDQPELRRPEPVERPLLASHVDLFKQTALHSRVVLNGEGGDELLYPPTVVDMLKGIPLRQAAEDVGRYVLFHRRRPALGLGIHAKLRQWFGWRTRRVPYPKWLNPDFEMRLDLRRRWEQAMNTKTTPIHTIRPEAYRRITFPLWVWFFEWLDSGVTSIPLEVRLPYLDLRLVDYLLAIAPLPWCANKELLRAAMRGTLPEAVCMRPKTPLAGHPFYQLLQQPEADWIDSFKPTPRLSQYISRGVLPRVARGACDPDESWVNLRPLNLDFWLRTYLRPASHSATEKVF